MKSIVMVTTTVRRRRGLLIKEPSQPWNWYVKAVTISRNAPSKGRAGSMVIPSAATSARANPSITGPKTIRLSRSSELR